MHERKLLAALPLCLTLFVACGGIETKIVISKSYGYSKADAPPKLAICIGSQTPAINYTGNVENEFGKGDPKELIWAFFKKQVQKDVANGSIFASVEYDELAAQPQTQPKTIDVNEKGDMSFSVPVKGSSLSCKSTTPDVVLILDDISIVSDFKISGNRERIDLASGDIGQSRALFFSNGAPVSGQFPMPVYNPPMYHTGPSFSTSKDLIYEAKMILWDNNAKDVVSYGFLYAIDENSLTVTMDDWLENTQRFVDKILDGTPFKKL